MKRPVWFFVFGIAAGVLLTVAAAIVGALALSRTDAGYRFVVRRAAARLRAPVFPQSAADYDWEAVRLETGETASAGELRGRVAFVTFWSLTCPYCVAQLPHIQSLYEQTREDDVAFWCVAEKRSDEDMAALTAKVAALREDLGLTVPVLLLDGPRPEAFRSRATPVTFIIAPDGTLAFRYDAGAKWDDEACLRYLRQLASGASPDAGEPAVPPT